MEETKVVIVEAEDVTEELLNECWSVVEGWYLDSPIEWEDLWNRVERHAKWDFGTEFDTPAMRKIQRVMREWKREATC